VATEIRVEGVESRNTEVKFINFLREKKKAISLKYRKYRGGKK